MRVCRLVPQNRHVLLASDPLGEPDGDAKIQSFCWPVFSVFFPLWVGHKVDIPLSGSWGNRKLA